MKLYIVDAFADKLFSGNPAAVCPLDQWLPDGIMQQIAFENNLAETAFVVKEDTHYRIRWFTPLVEVDLCGHATLASAHVLFNHLNYGADVIKFNSRSGELVVTRSGNGITLDFPTDTFAQIPLNTELTNCFYTKPIEVWKGKTDYMFVFNTQTEIENILPHLRNIEGLDARGVIITAPGNEVDFVSRFFAPQSGIDEDPVTGSAHTTLTPYWNSKTGKTKFTALQLSKRGGKLGCELVNDRVHISGQAITYLIGELQLNTL